MKKVLLAMMMTGQLLAQHAVAADKLTVGLIAVTEKEDVRKRWHIVTGKQIGRAHV